MFYQRNDWTVEVSNDPEFRGDHFDVLFDETRKANRPCARFVLFDDDAPESENAILYMLIFGGGFVQTWSYEPCMVQVCRRRRRIFIGVFRKHKGFPPADETSSIADAVRSNHG